MRSELVDKRLVKASVNRKLSLLLPAIIATIAGCGWFETRESFYANYSQAVSDGAIIKGWLPMFLPHSATNIAERHDIDTNEIWVQFYFSKDDLSFLLRSCEKIESTKVIYPRLNVTQAIDWWPSNLRGSLNNSDHIYKFYRCSQDTASPLGSVKKPAFLALDSDSAVAWYWLPS
jgi:hypothetical protein